MLKYFNNINTISFYFQNDIGEKVRYSDWKNIQDNYLSEISIINELYDNGFGERTEFSLDIDTLEVLRLGEIERKILNLPNNYPYEIFIEPDGVLTLNSFKFKYGFYDFAPNGNRLKSKRQGAFILINDIEYLLSESQFQICEEIDYFNAFPEVRKGGVVNLKKLFDLKLFATDSSSVFENFLRNQELLIPEKIKIDINFENGFFEVYPSVELENPYSFTNSFDIDKKNVKEFYSIEDGSGKTTRVFIYSQKEIEELNAAKALGEISDEDYEVKLDQITRLKRQFETIKRIRKVDDKETIKEISEKPELYFDDEIIEYPNSENTSFLHYYSERVKEIGVYTPKVYPFISPYETKWIPGALIKDKIHGDKKIHLSTLDILTNFIELTDLAVKENKSAVEWDNVKIAIDDAQHIIETAKKQLRSPDKPINPKTISDNTVLIIKENTEITEFALGNKSTDSLEYRFSRVPNLVQGIELKEYQKFGVSWLQSLFQEKFSGCLLADDMGLGKTLQLLYFIEWHSHYFQDNKPYLIVAPVSLLENWENEYSKSFKPRNLELKKLYGSVNLTKEKDTNLHQQDAQRLQFKHIILTNYETVRTYQCSLALVDFAIVAFDEAQKIKTPGTLVTNACKALKAEFKVAMTGTPVENSLVDIWCLMDLTVPGLLGNAKEFAQVYQNPLKNENTNIKELTEKLRDSIGDFLKRRLKSDVAQDLPNKFDNEYSRKRQVMPMIQLERYKQEIDLVNQIESSDVKNQKLRSIWAIRDISDHPYLIERQILKFTSEELVATSAKLQVTVGILHEIKFKNEKVIIFADRKETQKMLQKIVHDYFELFPSIINGDTPSSKQLESKCVLSRQQTIDRFQELEGFNVIIMSPIAAGVGLNVTKANHIIHYTRHWNPAKEEQATDRAYRIGQQKDVFVYYPMAVFPDDMKDELGNKLKSFDEILDERLGYKKNLAASTLFPSEQAEVTPDEMFGDIFGSKAESKPSNLLIKDLDNLYPNLFEASIAALYQKMGFDVYLTPYANDKGVDIVVLNGTRNYLIQAKQTKLLVGIDAVQEIYASRNYYERQFNEKFHLMIITNNDYSPSASSLANSNNVELFNRSKLEALVNNTAITIQDINRIESQRMSKI